MGIQTSSDKAFEEWARQYAIVGCDLETQHLCLQVAQAAWQASRQHIIDKLQSEETVEKCWKAIRDEYLEQELGDFKKLAKAAIAAMQVREMTVKELEDCWKAAIEASDARFVPMLASCLRILASRPIASWYGNEAGGYYASWDDATYLVKKTLEQLPEEYRK